MYLFQTANLKFREINLSDFNALLNLLNEKSVAKFLPGFGTRPRVKQWIDESMKLYHDYGHGLWVVETKESNEFVGLGGIVFQEIEGVFEHEISVLISRIYHHKGIALEVAEGCKSYAFNTLQIKKLTAVIAPENLSAIQTANKIDLNFEKQIIKWGKAFNVYYATKS